MKAQALSEEIYCGCLYLQALCFLLYFSRRRAYACVCRLPACLSVQNVLWLNGAS